MSSPLTLKLAVTVEILLTNTDVIRAVDEIVTKCGGILLEETEDFKPYGVVTAAFPKRVMQNPFFSTISPMVMVCRVDGVVGFRYIK